MSGTIKTALVLTITFLICYKLGWNDLVLPLALCLSAIVLTCLITKKCKPAYLVEFIIASLIAIVIVHVNTIGGRPVSREKICMSNMRVINAAMAFYNKDHTSAPLKIYDKKTAKTLQDNNYLKSIVSYCPIVGENAYYGLSLDSSGEICCPVHGSASHPNPNPTKISYKEQKVRKLVPLLYLLTGFICTFMLFQLYRSNKKS